MDTISFFRLSMAKHFWPSEFKLNKLASCAHGYYCLLIMSIIPCIALEAQFRQSRVQRIEVQLTKDLVHATCTCMPVWYRLCTFLLLVYAVAMLFASSSSDKFKRCFASSVYWISSWIHNGSRFVPVSCMVGKVLKFSALSRSMQTIHERVHMYM